MNGLLFELTVRGSVVFLIVWTCDGLMAPRMLARWRRFWWLLVPVAFLVPWKAAVLPVPASGEEFALPAAEAWAPVLSAPAETVVAASGWFPMEVLAAVWILGAVVSFGLLAAQTLGLSRRWSCRRFSTDERLLGVLEDCKALAGIRAPIGLIVSSEVEAPAIVGWLRPRILLPQAFVETADEERLRHVILHELAHFRFLDVPAGWLFAIVRCLHWFNPLAHLAAWRWAGFREEAADENAIRWSRQDTPSAYGETLLALVREEAPSPAMGVLAIGETFSNLKHRIRMITRYTRRTPQTLLALPVAVLLLALAVVQPTSAESAASPEQAKAVAVAAMEKWLKLADEGKYAQTWDEAAASFQKALTSAQWVAALESVRTPLGALQSRSLASAMMQKDVPRPDGGTLKGEFVIAQFETSFANMKFALETVTFERDNGTWKAAGYFIRPR
jgi:beta-lactamase regulating signal transducer with metallopeptidase domain